MDIRPAPSYLQFRARTAQIAKDENVSADAAAVRAATPPVPADDRDGNPRIKLLSQLRNPKNFDQLQPPDRAKPTYDLAAYAARRCVQAYLPADKIEDEVTADGGAAFKLFRRFSDAAFGYQRGDTVVIAFRGTEGGLNALRQWPLTNLRAFAVRRPRRHLGFQMAWERLRPDMVEWIERTLPKGGQLILTGHSLGGAIAILAAFELAEDYHVRAVVTIGAPRVGLAEFRDQYLRKPNRPVVAVEQSGDKRVREAGPRAEVREVARPAGRARHGGKPGTPVLKRRRRTSLFVVTAMAVPVPFGERHRVPAFVGTTLLRAASRV